jgi:hypothetical protein
MLESGLSGSVRGVPSNGHPYRDPGPVAARIVRREMSAPGESRRCTISGASRRQLIVRCREYNSNKETPVAPPIEKGTVSAGNPVIVP